MNPKEIIWKNGNKVLIDSTSTVVYMIDRNGSKLWETKITDPEFEHVFVNPYVYQGDLMVGTAVGVEYVLDPETGKVLKKIFMK